MRLAWLIEVVSRSFASLEPRVTLGPVPIHAENGIKGGCEDHTARLLCLAPGFAAMHLWGWEVCGGGRLSWPVGRCHFHLLMCLLLILPQQSPS